MAHLSRRAVRLTGTLDSEVDHDDYVHSLKRSRTPDIPQEPYIDMERWEIISG